MTAGSYCTYAVKFDGSVASIGEGSYGRLGHNQSDNTRVLNNIESLRGMIHPHSQLSFKPRVGQPGLSSILIDLKFAIVVFSRYPYSGGGGWGESHNSNRGGFCHSSDQHGRCLQLGEELQRSARPPHS